MTAQQHGADHDPRSAGGHAGPAIRADEQRVTFVTAIAKLLGWRGLILVGIIALLGAVSLFGPA